MTFDDYKKTFGRREKNIEKILGLFVLQWSFQKKFSSSGNVYLSQLLHYEIFKIGNLKENSLDKIYNSKKLNKFKMNTANCIGKCKECDFKLICGGACQARQLWRYCLR